MQTRLCVYAVGGWLVLTLLAIRNGVLRKAHEPVPVEEA